MATIAYNRPIMITTQYLFQRMKSSDKMFSVALKKTRKQTTEQTKKKTN